MVRLELPPSGIRRPGRAALVAVEAMEEASLEARTRGAAMATD